MNNLEITTNSGEQQNISINSLEDNNEIEIIREQYSKDEENRIL